MTDSGDDPMKRVGDRLPNEGLPLVVGAVVETIPDQAEGVALRLEGMDGVQVVGRDGKNRIAIVWDAPDGKQLEKTLRDLMQTDEEILGIYPTFAGLDEQKP